MASEFIEKVLSGALEKQDDLTFKIDAPQPGSPITQRGNRAYSPPVVAPPGFFETYGGNFSEQSEFASFARYIEKQNQEEFPDEVIPEGWDRFSVDAIEGFPDIYWDWILDGKNPREQELRRQKAIEVMAHKEYLSNGSGIAAFLGGASGALLSPSTLVSWFIPGMAAASRIGRVLGKVPAIAIDAATHNLLLQGGEIGGNVEQAIINAVRDTIFGTALFGVFSAVASANQVAGLKLGKRIVNKTYEGVDIVPRINEKTGNPDGFLAVAAEGQSVSAAVVRKAQDFINNGVVQRGLFGTFLKYSNDTIFGTPLFKGLSSLFLETRKFHNLLMNESIATGGTERGVPRHTTGTEILRVFENAGRDVTNQIHKLFLEFQGIKPGVVGDIKNFVNQVRDGIKTKDGFYEGAATVVLTGEESASREINEAAKLWSKHLDDIYGNYLEAYGYSKEIFGPRTAHGYLMRSHNIEEMLLRPDEWLGMAVEAYSKQDAEIMALKAPLDALEEQLKSARAAANSMDKAGRRRAQRSINRIKESIEAEKKNLTKAMQDGGIDPILLEKRLMLNENELAELKALLSPRTKLEARIKSAKDELPGLTKNEKKAARAKIAELEAELAEVNSGLNKAALTNKVNPNFYTKTKEGYIDYRSPKAETPRFRKLFDDVDDMELSAQGAYDKITGSTPEQITAIMFDARTGIGDTTPQMLRSLMVPDMSLLENGFLDIDPGKMIAAYTRSLGKRIAVKRTLTAMGHEDFDSLGIAMKNELDLRRNGIMKNPRTAKRDAKIKKLDKEFKKAKDLNKNAYEYFMGAHIKSEKAARYSKAIRNITSMVMLGKIALYQVGEIGGIVFKQGLFHPISTVLRKFLPGMHSAAKKSAMARENAAHALVGLEAGLARFSNEAFDSAGYGQNMFESYLQSAGKLSSVVSLVNFITNAQQRLSADITASRVMSSMYQMAGGKLSKVNYDRLIMNGIDPKSYRKWINAYEKAGGGASEYGGYHPNWYNWTDGGLRNQMRKAIHNDVQGSILQSNVGDKPYWSTQPVVGMPFHFMGYMYAASNKFFFPMMLKPDAEKFVGLFMMASYGMMVEPMRAVIRGEDPTEWFEGKSYPRALTEGLLESGVLGYLPAVAEMGTSMLGYSLTDKLRRRPLAGIYAGPPGSYAQGIIDTIQMGLDGTVNKKDVTKAGRLLPVPQPFWLEMLLRRGVESLNIPDTKSDAEYWDWVNRD